LKEQRYTDRKIRKP